MTSILMGIWFFNSLIYNGSPLPRPNPDLVMSLNFESAQTNILRYHHNNEHDLCERRAHYEFDGESLTQTVIWVNPQNSSSCAQDPDMKLGEVSTTPVQIVAGKMYMVLPLGEEQITYVWTRTLNHLSSTLTVPKITTEIP